MTFATAQGALITIKAAARVYRYVLGVTAMTGGAARDPDVQLTVVAQTVATSQ